MKYIVLFFIFINIAFANKTKHPIYNQIIKNQPKINKKTAMTISNHIHKMYLKYKIPRKIYTAILMQESGYSLKAKGKACGYTKNWKRACVYSDFGISQIHVNTAKLWGFDLKRLTKDLKYSIESGAKVLHYFMKRYSKKEKDWFARYNCGTKKNIERDTCVIYKALVERYM